MNYNLLEFLESLIDRPLTHEKLSKFNQPLSMIFQTLQHKNLLQPREPKLLPNPLLPHINLNLHYHFHQMIGHTIDGCKTLRNAILDLIGSKKVKDLEKKPSAEIRPLFKYRDISRTKNKSLHNHSIIP